MAAPETFLTAHLGGLRGPVFAAVLAGAGTLYTAFVDPNSSHAFPRCPLKALTGLDCPFCGSLRAVHSLTHGHIVDALSHNALFVSSIPFLVIGWLTWLRRERLGVPPRPLLQGRALVGVLIVAALFTVARNLPLAPLSWLGSTS